MGIRTDSCNCLYHYAFYIIRSSNHDCVNLLESSVKFDRVSTLTHVISVSLYGSLALMTTLEIRHMCFFVSFLDVLHKTVVRFRV